MGQGVQLRDSLQRLARRARSSTWPEYAELDCFACHHSLTAPKDSWRQEAAMPDARPGVPAWNAARFVVFRYAATATDAATATKLESEMATLTRLMGQLSGDREQIAASAERAADLADSLARELNSRSYDQAFTLQVMRKIAGDSRAISQQGQRAAEQAAMSLDSLLTVLQAECQGARTSGNSSAINRLIPAARTIRRPTTRPRFAAQLQKVQRAPVRRDSRSRQALVDHC